MVWMAAMLISFNTWAREEPNGALGGNVTGERRFNTWAREEPNQHQKRLDKRDEDVSILGLARSPTLKTWVTN